MTFLCVCVCVCVDRRAVSIDCVCISDKLLHMWNISLSASAVDLLSHLLCPAESRYTIDDVKEHPFLTASVHAHTLSHNNTSTHDNSNPHSNVPENVDPQDLLSVKVAPTASHVPMTF